MFLKNGDRYYCGGFYGCKKKFDTKRYHQSRLVHHITQLSQFTGDATITATPLTSVASSRSFITELEPS